MRWSWARRQPGVRWEGPSRATKGKPGQGGGHGGVPDAGEPTAPGWKLKAHGQGEGIKGHREEVAGHRATSECSGRVVRPPTAGVPPKWGKRESATAERPGDRRSPGLARLEPSTGPGNPYLDERLHLQVEFDNLLVTDPDVDILGGRHVGDADYRQQRWPSLNAFRPPGLAAAPPIDRPEASESGGAESWRLVLDTGSGGWGGVGLVSWCGPNKTERKREHQERFRGGLSPIICHCNGYRLFFA